MDPQTPAGIHPVIGTASKERIKVPRAASIDLSEVDWFQAVGGQPETTKVP